MLYTEKSVLRYYVRFSQIQSHMCALVFSSQKVYRVFKLGGLLGPERVLSENYRKLKQ